MSKISICGVCAEAYLFFDKQPVIVCKNYSELRPEVSRGHDHFCL